MPPDPADPRRPPSVERVLAAARQRAGLARTASILAGAARDVIDDERQRLRSGAAPRSIDALGQAVVDALDAHRADDPATVINATGVIVHTNLGRAPWSDAALAAAARAGEAVLLEIDRTTGRRGARFRRAEEHLIALTGAEDALVTNNNAAAVALAVGLVGRGRGVAVSRGELVEIGGGVRIPEIVRRAGARLVEVGTTNRTRAEDFEGPLADGAATAVLRVHPSNFTQRGFTESPDPAAVATLAHRHGAIVIDDLGSGALLPTEHYGLAHEPMPAERLEAGADLVTFSGDKLVGGPQAGLVVGRADLIARIRRDPLARAMRPDKATLLGVAATLGAYRAGVAESTIPVWTMLAADTDTLRARAMAIAAALGDAGPTGEAGRPGEVRKADKAGGPGEALTEVEVVALESTVGGGALPGQTLPSVGLAIRSRAPDAMLRRLRLGTPAVIGRIEDGAVRLDLRTVSAASDAALAEAVRAALTRSR